eukprot:5503723-Prymnesium_polylepis.2
MERLQVSHPRDVCGRGHGPLAHHERPGVAVAFALVAQLAREARRVVDQPMEGHAARLGGVERDGALRRRQQEVAQRRVGTAHQCGLLRHRKVVGGGEGLGDRHLKCHAKGRLEARGGARHARCAAHHAEGGPQKVGQRAGFTHGRAEAVGR